MFRIARDGVVELAVNVPEAELATIRPGQPAEVQLPSGAAVRGSVRTLSAEVSDESRLGGVRIALPASGDLRPGGFGQARFTAAAANVAAVPEDALRFDAQGVSLVTLTSGNRARRVPVRTGRRAGGWVELLSGPGAGTVVLLGGGAFVLDGEQVKPTAARPAQRAPAGESGAGGSVSGPNAAGQPATGAAPPPAAARGTGGVVAPGASR